MCKVVLTGVDDVHRTHSSAGIVEDPFLFEVEMRLHAVDLLQARHDVRDHGFGVVSMLLQSRFRDLLELVGVENEERFEVFFELEVAPVSDRCQKGRDGQEEVVHLFVVVFFKILSR